MPRTPPPNDWMVWTWLVAQEILMGTRVLVRLRAAQALARGEVPDEDAVGLDIIDGDYYNASRIRSPEELAKLPAKDLDALCEEWEVEIKRFGQILHAKHGETMRLRRLRREAQELEAGQQKPTGHFFDEKRTTWNKHMYAQELGYSEGRSFRRLLKGTKKARGGIQDLDPRLIREPDKK